jgi:hypothetical protein
MNCATAHRNVMTAKSSFHDAKYNSKTERWLEPALCSRDGTDDACPWRSSGRSYTARDGPSRSLETLNERVCSFFVELQNLGNVLV